MGIAEAGHNAEECSGKAVTKTSWLEAFQSELARLRFMAKNRYHGQRRDRQGVATGDNGPV